MKSDPILNLPSRKRVIAVLGAARSYTPDQIVLGFRTGRQIARSGFNLVTGATSGIPYAAALGALESGAMVVGISPATDVDEHVNRYHKPAEQADLIVFSGMGAAGRSPMILQSCTGAIFIGGEAGTLGEFCSAWMCGQNVLGILEGSGGITGSIRDLLKVIQNHWNSRVFFDTEPERLVATVSGEMNSLVSSGLCSDEPCSDVREIVARYLDGQGGA